MSENSIAMMITLAVFAGTAAWPVFLDGCALWAQRHPLQRLIAELESIKAEGLAPDAGA